MTPMLVNPGTAATWGVVTQGSTTSGQTGQLSLGAVTTTSPSYSTTQTSALSLDTSGSLRVNCITGCSSSGGSSLTDEGAFTQGTTSGTVAMGMFSTSVTNLTTGQAGALRSTNDRKLMVDLVNNEVAVAGATAPTFAVVAGSVYNTTPPAPTNGQALAQQADSVGRLLVNCGAGCVPGLSQGSTTSGQSGGLMMAAVTTTAPTYSTTQTSPLSLDTAGNLRINCVSGCTSTGGTAAADEATFTQGTTNYTPMGGFYNTSITNLTSGQGGAVALTAGRAMLIDTPSGSALLNAINSGAAAPGTTAPSTAVQMGGSDGTTLRALSTDSGGHLIVEPGNTANTTAWLVTLGTGTNAIGKVDPNTPANWGLGHWQCGARQCSIRGGGGPFDRTSHGHQWQPDRSDGRSGRQDGDLALCQSGELCARLCHAEPYQCRHH
jgi:hypothetical protein